MLQTARLEKQLMKKYYEMDARLCQSFIKPILVKLEKEIPLWYPDAWSSAIKTYFETEGIETKPRTVIQAQLQYNQLTGDHGLDSQFVILRELVNIRSTLEGKGAEMVVSNLKEIIFKQHMREIAETQSFKLLVSDMNTLAIETNKITANSTDIVTLLEKEKVKATPKCHVKPAPQSREMTAEAKTIMACEWNCDMCPRVFNTYEEALQHEQQCNGSLIESKDEKSEDQWSDKKDQCMQVTVKDVSGKVLNINTAPSDTIDFIKERIHNEWCIHPAHQRLFFNTVWLEDGKQLSHYNIKAGDVIKLPRNMERIQITVKDSTNRTGSFYFDRHDTIHSVKAKIRDEWQIPPSQQRLLFGYKPDLKDDCTLYDYNIQDKDRLHLVLRMHPKTSTRIQITVKDSQLTVNHTFHVDSSDTIYSVKKKIEDKYGVPPSIQRLVFCGAWQEDERILSECYIKDGGTLRMTLGLLFKDEDDGENYVKVELSDGIDKVIRTYCKVKKISPDHYQFSCQDQVIPHDCTDTVQCMGQTHHLDIITVKKVVLNVNVKDEDGMITKFCVRLQTQIHTIISTYSKRRETSAEQLLFTNNGAEISPNCKDTIESLAIEENDTIYVAKKTFGENLTERSIEIMYGMKGSGDNPSFRPHLQIIDMVEAKHRNHWKVSISKNPYYT